MSLPIEEILKLRHELHQEPELSGQESRSAARLKHFLSTYPPTSMVENLGAHGFAAIFEFDSAGPTVMFRCELDALPIYEDPHSLPYASKEPGVSHKCGHDGHMCMVAGLSPLLKNSTNWSGKVVLLFQPAEETGEGALSVLGDPRFAEIKPDFVFALHNLPGFKKNTMVLREGIFTAAVTSIIIQLKGVASHAAEPEKGNNPALAVASILQMAAALSNNEPENEAFALITPVYMKMGQKAYGMSAGQAEIHFTIRAWRSVQLTSLLEQFITNLREILMSYDLQGSHEFLQTFASSENDPEAVSYISNAASKNGQTIETMQNPFKFGEDFGIFTQHYKGAIFGIGAGIDCPPLHHKDYDFPDDLIETGIMIFATIAELILKK